MLAFAAKSSLVLLVAWGITAAMRRSSAASRHVVWSCALLTVLLLPIATALVPALPLPWLAEIRSAPSAGEFVVAHAASLPAMETFVAEPARTLPAPRSADAMPAVPPRPFPIAAVLLMVWAIGSVLVLLRMAAGFWRRATLTQRCEPLTDSPLRDTVRAYARSMGIARTVRVLVAPSEMMPATWGLVRPRVLLPPSAHTWQPDRVRLVLVHELSHIVRFDTLTAAIAYLATALAWWNPLVWLATSRAQLERERACDDAVIRSGLAPSTYAEELLAIAQTLPSPFAQRLALAMAKPHRIERRLDAILDTRQRRTGTSHLVAAAASVLMALQLPLAAVTTTPPAAEPPAPENTTPAGAFNTGVVVTPPRMRRAPQPEAVPTDTLHSRSLSPAALTPPASTEPPATSPMRLDQEAPRAPSSASLVGVWAPATERDAERLQQYFDVGMASIRGRFVASDEPDGVILRQELPANTRAAFVAVMGRDPDRVPMWACGCKLIRRGDDLDLAVLSQDRTEPIALIAFKRDVGQAPAPRPIPEGQFGAGAYRPGNGVSNPIRTRAVKPRYTKEALDAHVQGRVELEGIIRVDGVITEVRVTKSLDTVYGLDESAKAAVRDMAFEPCKIGDQAVPCVVVFELEFRLPNPPRSR